MSRGAATEATVWPLFIAVTAVVFDERTSFSYAEHEFAVEAFVTEASMEALNVPVLPGSM